MCFHYLLEFKSENIEDCSICYLNFLLLLVAIHEAVAEVSAVETLSRQSFCHFMRLSFSANGSKVVNCGTAGVV